ncbi:GNAT family N-acetyltransferase [Peterkaempfera griseoplana]|uniref:GNAT family N-acetyltransferase n=1 Tax=Peterkaempfera griseoplana TaxID=66896 RepID=UPI0006E2E018|nr:GNAT family N-acetyltransferase [Peterkaempfera griseoplana]
MTGNTPAQSAALNALALCVVLRPLNDADADDVQRIYSGPDRAAQGDADLTAGQARDLIANAAEAVDGVPLQPGMVGVTAEGRLVGTIGLRSAGGGHWRVGCVLRDDVWGRGYATAALQQVVTVAFRDPAVCSLDAKVRLDNPASARVLAKSGFRLVGQDDRFRHFVLDRPSQPPAYPSSRPVRLIP